MKKEYINPTIAVVLLQTKQQLMAGSPGLGGEYDGSATPESRSFDFDDWEDE